MSMFIVVAYDISDDRRLKRTAAVMEKYGVRVQRSIFECVLSQKKFDELVMDLKGTVNRRVDKVRIYRFCRSCQKNTGTQGQSWGEPHLDVLII
ncbi:MAG: CRISPR-associated endonuclease Cas2 [Acidobacteria bacterium]|nr:CRISPR-associated endonuclease Cas2 [Acidobacteriota bacterium]